MCSAGIKKYFLSSYFVWCIFFIKDGMFYEVVYNRESPSRIIRKVRFIRCWRIHVDILLFIFVTYLLLRKRYIVRHYNYVINTITLSCLINQ